LTDSTEQRAIDVIRGIAMDGPHAARSGHQGTAMALAPLATVLWGRVMCYDPTAPEWFDRDRFVLSAGHASILQYAALHLAGYDVTLDDLRAFRQWGSRTPGHPESGHTVGVEVTTGPLGQGFANGVGMAMAEQHVRTRFGPELCDHHIFAICSDGDLQEGLSHEAASLAGHLGLGRLVYVWDDNRVSIDGYTDLSFTDNTPARFESYGWHVIELADPAQADDPDVLEQALRTGMDEQDRPTLIALRTIIGHPSPDHAGTPAAHGLPFSAEDIARTKEVLGLPVDEAFHVPDDVAAWFAERGARGHDERLAWEAVCAASPWREEFEAARLGRGLAGWETKLPTWEPGTKVATRKASQACFNAALDVVPGLLGGGADLTGNSGVALDGAEVLSAEAPGGRQIYFGIREHAMAATMNGMARHGGVLPVGGTFFIFSDYARPAIRLAGLMGCHEIFSLSHDSVAVGEDGPTHQPVEQLASLRAVPGPGGAAPGRRQRDGSGLAGRGRTRRPRAVGPHPPGRARAGGHRRRRRRPSRRLRAGRPRHRSAGGAHRHRQRGVGVPGGRRCARRRRRGRPGGLHAVLGAVRIARRRLPRRGAARGCAPPVGGGRHHLRLGALGRRLDRHRPLRRQRPGRPGPDRAGHPRRAMWSTVPGPCWPSGPEVVGPEATRP
jgi:transketolase